MWRVANGLDNADLNIRIKRVYQKLTILSHGFLHNQSTSLFKEITLVVCGKKLKLKIVKLSKHF